MRKVLKWILIVGAIGAVAAGIFWFREEQRAEVPLEILRSAELELGVLEISVSASGSIAVNEKTQLFVQTPGRIAEVIVREGDPVAKGQVLARLDADDLARNLRQAEIALELAELSRETALEPVDIEDISLAKLAVASSAESLELARLGKQTALVDANATIVQAERQREQAHIDLRDADADGGKKYEDAQLAFAEAEAEEKAARINAEITIQQAESQYQAAYIAYQQAQTALEKLQEESSANEIQQQEILTEQACLQLDQARRAVSDTEIVAPYDGLVALVGIEESTYIGTGQLAFSLLDNSALYVDVTIDEIDISAVEEGQTVVVVLDAYPEQELVGLVKTIAPGPSEIGGLVAYRVRVELQDNPNIRILEGMTASVTISTNAFDNILLLPTWAIRVDQESGEAYTYVSEDGVAVRRPLELGRRNDTYSEVLSGVSEGETVALVLEERTFTPPGTGGDGGGSPFD